MSNQCCEGARRARFSRRYFLKQGGIGLVGLSTMPAFLQRAVASTTGAGKKQLVVLFQRGAADGLNIVVPFAEPNYYRMRPTIAIPAPKRGGGDAVLDLDGFFGLHPGLAALTPLFQKNQLAIVHAAGSPDPTRSHFDAQDYMESGTPGVKATEDGWLDRAIGTVPEENASPFRAVAMGPNLPRMLQGSTGAIAIPDLRQFKVQPQSAAMANVAEGGFEAMYSQSVDHALHGTGAETFEAIDMLRKIDTTKYPPDNGADYPKSAVGQRLQQIGGDDQSEYRSGSVVPGLRRLGQPRERRRRARTVGEFAEGPGAIAGGVSSGHGRPDGGHCGGHHERIRTHSEREWKPRNRPRARELHVCDGRRCDRADEYTENGRD